MLRFIYLLTVLMLTCSISHADTVLMTNGDQLIGQILSMENGKMTFKSDILGKVNIPMNKIKTFQTDDFVELHFKEKPLLKAKVRNDQPGKITIDHTTTLKPQSFNLTDLHAINPPKINPIKNHGSVTLGLTSSHGNTFDESGNLSFDFTRETIKTPHQPKTRWNTRAIYVFSRTEENTATSGRKKKVTTEENMSINSKFDHYFSDKRYGFMSGSWKKDHIADLDRRLIAGLGVGFEWINDGNVLLTSDIGAAFLHEKFVTLTATDTNDEISAQLGYTCNLKINDRFSLHHHTTYYPSFENFSDYFLNSSLEFRAKMNSAWHVGFKTILDYDATPGQGSSTTDIKYILGVGASF